jgi:hypothetical protein
MGDGLSRRAGRRRQAHAALEESAKDRVVHAGVRQMEPAQTRRVQQAAEETPGEHGVVVEDPGEAGDLDLGEQRGVEALLRVGRQRQQLEVAAVAGAQRVEAGTVRVEEFLVDEAAGHGRLVRLDGHADERVRSA